MKYEQFIEENNQTFFLFRDIKSKPLPKPTQIKYTLILQNLGHGHFVKN